MSADVFVGFVESRPLKRYVMRRSDGSDWAILTAVRPIPVIRALGGHFPKADISWTLLEWQLRWTLRNGSLVTVKAG